jgi:hypothetical protein
VEPLRKKERQDEAHEPSKYLDGFLSFTTPLNANVIFLLVFFFNLTLVYDQTQGTGAVFS